MQQRICDCQLRVGGCYCKLETDDKGTIRDSEGSDNASKQVLRDTRYKVSNLGNAYRC